MLSTETPVLGLESICPACRSQTAVIYDSLPAFRKGLPDYTVYECPNCGMQYVEPRTELHGVYDEIYAHANRMPGYDRYAMYAKHVKRCKDPAGFLASIEPAYWAIFQALHRHQIDLIKPVLEVGSGLGYLTFAINKLEISCIGVDVSLKSVNQARSDFGDYFGVAHLSDLETGGYSAVVLSEVIEHVSSPVEFLQDVARLLTHGGIIVITTPNRDAHSSTSIWQTDLPPVHFSWFTISALKQLAKASNLRYESVDLAEYDRKWPSRIKQTLDNGAPTQSALDELGLPHVTCRDLRIMRARRIANDVGVFYPLVLAGKRIRAYMGRQRGSASSFSTRRQAAAVFIKD